MLTSGAGESFGDGRGPGAGLACRCEVASRPQGRPAEHR